MKMWFLISSIIIAIFAVIAFLDAMNNAGKLDVGAFLILILAVVNIIMSAKMKK